MKFLPSLRGFRSVTSSFPRSARRPSWPLRALATLLSMSLALMPAPALVHAQNLPKLGEESETVLSPTLERRIGEEYYRELRGSPDYFDDPEVAAYVQELGERLIAASPEPNLDVQFFVMKDNSINAFAMLGGFIGVNTGLLQAAQSESEAASVLGHEIGHLIQKHLARSVSAGQKMSIASMIGTALCLLAARSSSQGAQACLMFGAAIPVSQQLAYSRDFEREADRIGFDILRKGGFDVSAMPTFFERLQKASGVYDSNVPVYVRTHPLTTERIADVRNRAQGVTYRQFIDSTTFHLVRAKLRATVDTSVDGRREALRFFTTQLAEKTYANISAVHYGYAWALLLDKQYDKAQAELAQITTGVTHPMIASLGAAILLARGDSAGAIKAYRAAIDKYPRARYLQIELIEALQKAGNHEEALKLLRDQVQNYKPDAKLYEMQAKSYAATGKGFQEHEALAEYHAQMGHLQQAISELMTARCTGQGDFYQLSIVDARIRTYWEQMLDAQADKEGSGSDDKGGHKRMPMGDKDRPPEARCRG